MNDLDVLIEPFLEFNHHQRLQDPHDGLTLFGPYGACTPTHPTSILYGVIGAPEGISSFIDWSRTINRAIWVDQQRDRTGRKPLNPNLWPPFPGFEAAFCSTWPESPAWVHELDRADLIRKATELDPYKRAFGLVNEYVKAIQIAKKRDEALSVIICVVPEEIWQNCRPKSYLTHGTGERLSRHEKSARLAGQRSLLDSFSPQQYELSIDFRRQIKALVMEYGVPIQIIRESTLRLNGGGVSFPRGLTPLPDRAWNLMTALYYKAGGKPWKLATARKGVCYVGIAYRRVDGRNPSTACCAAQMFLDSGDGIVFLGEYGPWYSPRNRQYHLSKSAAKNLLTGVLKTYEELEGQPLSEIFLHARSDIASDEFAGFKEACPSGVTVVGVRIRSERHGVRLFRTGTRPVLRGTFWKVTNRSGFLWASGFKPRWQTYDGSETPVPLRIDIQHGEAGIKQVVQDIFGLTKLNYNSCKLGFSEPVTIGFSDAVGEILVSNPTIQKRSPSFKFYI